MVAYSSGRRRSSGPRTPTAGPLPSSSAPVINGTARGRLVSVGALWAGHTAGQASRAAPAAGQNQIPRPPGTRRKAGGSIHPLQQVRYGSAASTMPTASTKNRMNRLFCIGLPPLFHKMAKHFIECTSAGYKTLYRHAQIANAITSMKNHPCRFRFCPSGGGCLCCAAGTACRAHPQRILSGGRSSPPPPRRGQHLTCRPANAQTVPPS